MSEFEEYEKQIHARAEYAKRIRDFSYNLQCEVLSWGTVLINA